jgi:hypothetical protein
MVPLSTKVINMNLSRDLFDALTLGAQAKENGRAAGAGIWGNYVPAVCYARAGGRDAEALDVAHKELVAELESIGPLTKDHKNSLTSAKSVVKKAIMNGVDIWRREADGSIVFEADKPVPRGKNDLQESKSDYEKVLAQVDALIKKFESETREPFTVAQLETIAGRLLVFAEGVNLEKQQAEKGSPAAPF